VNPFSIKTLDASDEVLDCRGLRTFKRQTSVKVQGTNAGDVGFNGFGHKGMIAE
jgi:hypothetical protein